MTVIAFDGKTVAADKQATIHATAHTVTKIFRITEGRDLGCVVAFTGSGVHAMELLEWFKSGRQESTFPKSRSDDKEKAAGSVMFTPSGQIFLFSSDSPFPECIEEKVFARGSGGDYALAALHLGKTAEEAVALACKLDVYCGMGIDMLEIKLNITSNMIQKLREFTGVGLVECHKRLVRSNGDFQLALDTMS
jgi:ATP-dependent protease HslVU (ClpYQ) peptidase subunit